MSLLFVSLLGLEADVTADGSERLFDVWHNCVIEKDFLVVDKDGTKAPPPSSSSSSSPSSLPRSVSLLFWCVHYFYFIYAYV